MLKQKNKNKLCTYLKSSEPKNSPIENIFWSLKKLGVVFKQIRQFFGIKKFGSRTMDEKQMTIKLYTGWTVNDAVFLVYSSMK